jgi:hypothetical protein
VASKNAQSLVFCQNLMTHTHTHKQTYVCICIERERESSEGISVIDSLSCSVSSCCK